MHEIPSPLQAHVNHINALEQTKRAESEHYTLGQIIEVLNSVPDEYSTFINVGPSYGGQSINAPHSYRGYYCDLAFAPSDEIVPVGQLLKVCQQTMGKVFVGYKGGDFLMGENTPVWISPYGEASGVYIIDIKINNVLKCISFVTGIEE